MNTFYQDIKKVVCESVALEFFGKDFVSFKNRVDAGEAAIEVAEAMLTKVGEGSTRIVYGFNDNLGIVLKIVNWNDNIGVNPETGFDKHQMVASNKWESDLQMQQKYPGIFPRTFEHSDDFSWIISEKVRQVKSYEELFVLLGLTDEKFSKLPFVRNIQFQALIELGISYFQEPAGPAQQMLRENEIADMSVTKTKLIPRVLDDEEEVPEPGLTAMARRLKKLISNRQNAQLLAAMGDLDIPAGEFSPKNIGVSLITGKLILLDISLWKEHKPVKEQRKIRITRNTLERLVEDTIKLSSGIKYHIDNNVGVDRNIFRPASKSFFALFREARNLSAEGLYQLSESEKELIEETDIGEWGMFEGERVPLDFPMLYEEDIDEAKYKGREVKLGKKGAKRGEGGKAYVYVRNPKTKKIKKVTFGSSLPDAMGDSDSHKKRRKSFGARHNCAKKDDKTKPGYWACRATKMFGRNISGWW